MIDIGVQRLLQLQNVAILRTPEPWNSPKVMHNLRFAMFRGSVHINSRCGNP